MAVADTLEFVVWRARAIPTRLVALVLALVAGLGILSAAACGCSGGGAQTPTLTPRQISRATVATLDSAFVAGAKACLAVAKSEQNDQIRQQCASAFQPMIAPLETAADAVDAWGDATQGQVACLAQDIVAGLGSAGVLLQSLGIPVPVAIADATAFAQPFMAQCVREGGVPDAGASSAADSGGVPAPTPTTTSGTSLRHLIVLTGGAL